MENLSLSTSDGVDWSLQFHKFLTHHDVTNSEKLPNWNSDHSIEIKDPPSPFLWCQERSVAREPPVESIHIPATVPGNVHEDLMNANVLKEGHPYFGMLY